MLSPTLALIVQREANRLLSYTAQQTLDYLQQLYEKKLVTYPRTDARYLTDDMVSSVPALVPIAAAICNLDAPTVIDAEPLCNSKKVTDHHAILPTSAAAQADISALPEVMRLLARRLLCAVSKALKYAETTVTIECGGFTFTAKGKTVLTPGWKAYAQQEQTDQTLPEITEGRSLNVVIFDEKGVGYFKFRLKRQHDCVSTKLLYRHIIALANFLTQL